MNQVDRLGFDQRFLRVHQQIKQRVEPVELKRSLRMNSRNLRKECTAGIVMYLVVGDGADCLLAHSALCVGRRETKESDAENAVSSAEQ